jgi:hypothetical protein
MKIAAMIFSQRRNTRHPSLRESRWFITGYRVGLESDSATGVFTLLK